MTTLNKALTRPATIMGIPLVPFVIVSGFILLLSVYISYSLALLLLPVWVEMKVKARADVHYFGLLWLAFKTRGRFATNKRFGVNALLAGQYDAVDISEFMQTMKLNQCITLDNYLPYSTHVHPQVIRNRCGDFVATWEVDGTLFEGENEHHLTLMATHLNNVIRAYEGLPVTFYVHRIREKYHDAFAANSGIPFSDEVTERYYQPGKDKPLWRHRLFFTLCYAPRSELDEALNVMLEYRENLSSALSRYQAQPLGLFEEKRRVYSSQLSFYHRLLSGKWQRVAVTRTPFYDLLGTSDLFFSTDTAECRTLWGSRFFRALEIKDYSPETATGLLDALLYAESEYVLTQSFTCMARDEAQQHIRLAEKRLNATDDDALSQREELIVLRDLLQSGHVSCGKYHFSLLVSADNADQVVKDSNTLAQPFADLGIMTTLSTLSLPAAYLAQLPGVYTLRPRLVVISSQNYADMASLHNFHPHKRDGNPWGEAIAILTSPGGGGYCLNLHDSQVGRDDFNEKTPGNTAIIGKTGSGKTLLMTVLQQLMQKYRNPATFAGSATIKRLTTVYFDKDRAAEMAIRQMGGHYFRIRSGVATGFNPFSLAPTRRNIGFIKHLVRMLCRRNGAPLDPRDEQRISTAVETIMLDYPQAYRRFGITRLLEVLPEAPTREARTNGLRIRLKPWAQGGEFGWVFDNEQDSFDIGDSDNMGIDGTEFLDDDDIRGPVTCYLLYRVTGLLDGRRLVMFMDEFWKWLADVEFSDFSLNMLKVIRKLNGIFIAATQSPDEIVRHPIAPAIIEQCSTQLFLANPKASRTDYVEKLKVPESVYDIVRNLDPGEHYMVVVKTPLHTGETRPFIALAKMDLSGLGRLTKLLSGTEDNLKLFDTLYQPGMPPGEWKEKFLALAI
ncbi:MULTISPECIES: VirB3 family type IV secretion system protein [unclassified Symbiopectobacterium]|uniref:VirB4 family type IV secretion/conjugal transfer ATPase n=1 Tax=unclassified Symbiopectobacterium TaxID=2794573 RepID=UPI002226451A|nr:MULTISPECIES: VirB3 family type IV secretion system protein [unclassified Symbiopectobacterium]MCW2474525.1 VirB3 family type IV secretion system protein [Candidatus Symbiopectobacterium sp. NZEC151]MCW2488833.1 VirB3 family type IV secretion system protein [Candidatus Symbiopectobacterium sp. NZEC127]